MSLAQTGKHGPKASPLLTLRTTFRLTPAGALALTSLRSLAVARRHLRPVLVSGIPTDGLRLPVASSSSPYFAGWQAVLNLSSWPRWVWVLLVVLSIPVSYGVAALVALQRAPEGEETEYLVAAVGIVAAFEAYLWWSTRGSKAPEEGA